MWPKPRLRYPQHQPWPLRWKWNCPSLQGEFGDRRGQRAIESRVLTLHFVYIPEGNFSSWERSGAGRPTCRWGLSVVDGPVSSVEAPGHVGGTWKHTHRDKRPPALRLLKTYLCMCKLMTLIWIILWKTLNETSLSSNSCAICGRSANKAACHCEPLAHTTQDTAPLHPGVFTDDPGCKSNFIVVSKNLLSKQNNNPVWESLRGFGDTRVGICLFITSSSACLFKKGRKASCPHVLEVFVYQGTKCKRIEQCEIDRLLQLIETN